MDGINHKAVHGKPASHSNESASTFESFDPNRLRGDVYDIGLNPGYSNNGTSKLRIDNFQLIDQSGIHAQGINGKVDAAFVKIPLDAGKEEANSSHLTFMGVLAVPSDLPAKISKVREIVDTPNDYGHYDDRGIMFEGKVNRDSAGKKHFSGVFRYHDYDLKFQTSIPLELDLDRHFNSQALTTMSYSLWREEQKKETRKIIEEEKQKAFTLPDVYKIDLGSDKLKGPCDAAFLSIPLNGDTVLTCPIAVPSDLPKETKKLVVELGRGDDDKSSKEVGPVSSFKGFVKHNPASGGKSFEGTLEFYDKGSSTPKLIPIKCDFDRHFKTGDERGSAFEAWRKQSAQERKTDRNSNSSSDNFDVDAWRARQAEIHSQLEHQQELTKIMQNARDQVDRAEQDSYRLNQSLQYNNGQMTQTERMNWQTQEYQRNNWDMQNPGKPYPSELNPKYNQVYSSGQMYQYTPNPGTSYSYPSYSSPSYTTFPSEQMNQYMQNPGISFPSYGNSSFRRY